MIRVIRIVLTLLGILSLVFGSYLWTLNHLVKKEIAHMKQGILRHSRVEQLKKLPFAPRDVLEYDAAILLFQRMLDVTFTVDRLNRIIAETKSPDMKFRAYVLLAQIYSRSGAEYAFELGPEYAIEMYIQALKIKPEDYHAKLALEKLLSRVEKKEKKGKEKERTEQILPREGAQGRDWATIQKGDSL